MLKSFPSHARVQRVHLVIYSIHIKSVVGIVKLAVPVGVKVAVLRWQFQLELKLQSKRAVPVGVKVTVLRWQFQL